MTTRPAPEKPDWLVPGVAVLVVRGWKDDSVVRTTVSKVHKRYFTVDSMSFDGLRFSLDRQQYQSPGAFSSPTRVIPIDSDEAKKLLESARKSRLVRQASHACEQWMKNRTGARGLRLAAIAALQAVEDDE